MHARSSDVAYYFVLLRHKNPTSVIEVFSPCASTNISDNNIGVKEKLIAVRCDVHVLLAYSSEAAVIYRVSQEECAKLRESVPYVKVYRYNRKHLYPIK
jgi:pyruvate/2-oxoacid:ferredoxin oxidoreductase beta subunit